MEAINLKTGNKYIVVDTNITNATNANDGQKMILYGTKDKDGKFQLYVREKTEFFKKFKITCQTKNLH